MNSARTSLRRAMTPKKKVRKYGTKSKDPNERPVYSDEDRTYAVQVIQRSARCRRARNVVKRKRNRAKQAQRIAGQLIWWAAVSIQKIARARQGRHRFRKCQVDFARSAEERIYNAATTIQCMYRKIEATLRVRALLETRAEERKLEQWNAYKKEEEEKEEQRKREADPVYPSESQSKEIDEKLARLSELEAKMREKEKRMELTAKEAEARAKEMQTALKMMNDRAAAEEAERAARKELMAAGSIPNTQRTDAMASTGPAVKKVPESAR